MKRTVVAMTALSLLAQLIGFGKSVLMGHLFGVSIELDGFYLAQIVPALISAILLGAIQSGFVPVYMRIRDDREQATRLRSSILVRLAMFSVVITLVSYIFAAWLVRLLAPQAAETVLAVAEHCYRIIALAFVINLLADYLGLVLNAEMRFAAVALSGALNVLVATAVLWLWPQWGVDNLVWGLVAGSVLQLLANYLQLRRIGKRLVLLPGYTPELRAAQRLALHIFPGLVFSNLSMTIPQVAVATLGVGAISVFGYASRFHGVLVQTVVLGTSTVLLSHFAMHAAQQRHHELANTLRRAFAPALTFCLAAILWVYLAGQAALHFLFGAGRMTAIDIAAIHQAWLVLTLALPVILWGIFCAKALQALGRAGSLSWLSLVGLCVTATAAWYGMSWGVGGVAAAVGISYTIVALLTFRVVRSALQQPVLLARDGLFAAMQIALASAIGAVAESRLAAVHMADLAVVATVSLLCLLLAGYAYKLAPNQDKHENR